MKHAYAQQGQLSMILIAILAMLISVKHAHLTTSAFNVMKLLIFKMEPVFAHKKQPCTILLVYNAT